MKKAGFAFILSLIASLSANSAVDSFLQKYQLIYQDLVINNQIYPVGTDICNTRYELVKPILNQYNRPFTLLDLGAAQGYFSLRIASEYPHSTCVMIEANNTSYYAHHGDMLYDLCQMNPQLDNIYYLQKRVDIEDLQFVKQKQHFDIVLAFLVVHLMHDQLDEQIKILNSLLEIGDNLIIEVANDVHISHTNYVEFLSHKLGAVFLGELRRHKDPKSTSTGKFYWFKSRDFKIDNVPRSGIQSEIFKKLNGVYPYETK